MPYRKPWDRLPPSRRSELDRDFKALNIYYHIIRNCWIPMGTRSSVRFQRLLKCSPAFLEKVRSERITFLATTSLRSIPEPFFKDFLRLAKHKGFSIYHKGKNLTPKLRVRSERNQWRFERDMVAQDEARGLKLTDEPEEV